MKGIAKVQHYVPQFLLKNFSQNKKIQVYDKTSKKSYSPNVSNVACQSRFYDFVINVDGMEIEGTIEEKLSSIEYDASKVIKDILERDNVNFLSDDDRNALAIFISLQMIRTLNTKYNFEQMPRKLREYIETNMPNMAKSCDLAKLIPDFSKGDLNLYFDSMIAEWTEKTTSCLRDLDIILVKSNSKHFVIGDNPVIVNNELFNDKNNLYFSREAIGYKGACVFLPLSPYRALWLLCPEFEKKLIEETQGLDVLVSAAIRMGGITTDLFLKCTRGLDIRNAILNSKTLNFEECDIDKFNFFEITRAERQVFSINKCDKSIQSIISKNDFYEHGPRFGFY